ncbi:MAG: ATP-dependent zinc metalloprotease FtsH [Alphaproteobacteria bacterium]|nr:ATP-dependent zinc metalloprotease FtsH [Alphaproteobacteria bacterium]
MNAWPKWLPALVLVGLLVLFALFAGVQWPARQGAAPVDIPYTEFKGLVAENQVQAVTLKGNRLTGRLRGPRPLGPGGRVSEGFATEVPSFGDPALLPALEKAAVPVTVAPAEEAGGWRILMGLLPWLLFLGIYWWFWRRMYRNIAGGLDGLPGRGDITDMVTGKKKEEDVSPPQVTFDDVAGQDNAKREVAELVDFLRDPEKYTCLGAEVPRGILLMGPPGTGKTLLARALAGEAQVPFYSISASEFIEVFVGVGASRVRRMFDEAKARQPSIIFIDELDSVGRVRGTGFGGGHDEREQTLNQILAEMDGFEGHESVIVLAATNRPDVLDPALLRPGRFDRHVTLDLPDKAARAAILKVHTKKMPLDADVDLETVAAGTPGFSGADLKNLANEAAMLAAREGGATVTMAHFDAMRDRIMMGTVRTLAIQPEERHRLAVHEAGHVACAHFLPEADPLYKVTIIPRGKALGATHQLPEEERHTLPESYLHDRIAVMLGGRVAEQEFLGSVSSGADDDIRGATVLARAMVARWGMSKKVGPVDLRESDEHPFLGREIALPRRFSESAANQVDEAVRELILAEEARAAEVIRTHRGAIETLVERLETQESLDRAEIEAALGPPPPKKRRGREGKGSGDAAEASRDGEGAPAPAGESETGAA